MNKTILLLAIIAQLTYSSQEPKQISHLPNFEFERQWDWIVYELQTKKKINNKCPRCGINKNNIKCVLLH